MIGQVLFFRRHRLWERCQEKTEKERKKNVRDLGESAKVGRTGAALCRSIRFPVCVELTRPSLWTLSAALLFLSSPITASPTSDTAPRHAGKRLGKCNQGRRRRSQKPGEASNSCSLPSPLLPSHSILPLWPAFLSNVKPFTWNDSRRPSGGGEEESGRGWV